jgi:hypothetical protein
MSSSSSSPYSAPQNNAHTRGDSNSNSFNGNNNNSNNNNSNSNSNSNGDNISDEGEFFFFGGGSGDGSGGSSDFHPIAAQISEWAKAAAVAALRFGMLVFGVSVLSIVTVLIVKSYVTPHGHLINKRVYFNFELARPLAKIDLINSKEDQWSNLKTVDSYSSSSSGGMRFLKRGMSYNIDAVFLLSKSERNFEIGKFMASFTAVDASGDITAKSIRPVVMPYRSPIVRVIESLTSLCSIPGSSSTVVAVPVSFVNNYFQHDVDPATKFLEFELSSSNFDIEDVRISVVPNARGLG